ncbi:MAG: hypothetical protein WDO19_28130 [Bacteroidota bacterium]
MLVLHNTYSLDKKTKVFREELLKIPGVENATITSNLPTATSFSQNGWFRDPTLDGKQISIMTTFFVDENYIPALGMSMSQGRNFSPDFPSDSTGLIH